MTFSNLLEQTKKVTVGGVGITLKKFSFGFTNWLALKQYEGRELKLDEKDTKTYFVQSAGTIENYQFAPREKILNAVKSWDLKKQDGAAVEVSPEVVEDLLQEHAEFCQLLLFEIDEFCTLDEGKKKSLENS
jgi:hypothetical protein